MFFDDCNYSNHDSKVFAKILTKIRKAMSRKERLTETYHYLRGRGYIHTQLDLANRIGYNKSNVSSAFSGKESYLTDGFLLAIQREFPELSEEWLLKGTGDMLKLPSQIIGNVDARCNRGFAGNMSGGNYTIHHDEGKDQVIDEQKKEVDKMFEAIIVAVNGFQKASERHDDYIVRQDDYIKRQDEYIARIINNSYQRNRENMERIDALFAAMNEDRQKSREQLDRVLAMLENKLGL